MNTFAYRPPWPAEMERTAAMLRAPGLLRPGFHPRVWAAARPERFVGGAAWQLAEDGKTGNVFFTLVPRCQNETLALELLRPLFAEAAAAGAKDLFIFTHEGQPWGKLLGGLGLTKQWTDESWVADPVKLRQRLARFDLAAREAEARGWTVRPFAEEDWALVEKWGLAEEYFSRELYEAMRKKGSTAWSGVAMSPQGVAGLQVVTRAGLTGCLEFIVGNPERPAGWPVATMLLLRRLAARELAAAPCDVFVLNTNLNKNRAMHAIAKRSGMRLDSVRHHFFGPMPKLAAG